VEAAQAAEPTAETQPDPLAEATAAEPVEPVAVEPVAVEPVAAAPEAAPAEKPKRRKAAAKTKESEPAAEVAVTEEVSS
jgi:hypothetical protein